MIAHALRIAVTGVLLLVPFAAEAQQTQKMHRIGTLLSGSPASHGHYVDWFRQGLRDIGYTEGRDYVIISRWGKGKRKRLPALVKELIKALPERQQTALILRHLEDMSYAEIAEMMGVAESTARVQVRDAREALRAAIAEKSPDWAAEATS